MLQQVVRVGSIFLVISTCLSAMERPVPEQIATTMLATPHARYYVKVLRSLPSRFGISFDQHFNTPKSALPVALLSYKLHKLQGQHYQLRLLLANNQQVQLTPELSSELVQASATIQNLIQDLEEQSQEIPLPLLTQEQVITLLSYISSINSFNISDSTLPMLQQVVPETATLSSYWINYTAIQQLKKHLTAQTIPALCNLIIAASYLDIQSEQQAINFIKLATQALGNKLLQSPIYQEDYDVINTLPTNTQHMLVQYLIDTSTIRYALCGNSTNVIASTAQTLTGHTGWVESISWSPNGKYIASGSFDRAVRIWNANTGTCIHTLEGHTESIYSVAWSPDSKHIASGADDITIKVWDATTGSCIHTLTGHTSSINSVSWSPDGKHIASGSRDYTIRVWDVTTGTCIQTLFGHNCPVNSVSWSPDSKYIASGADDMTIKVWDTTTYNCIHNLIGHTERVWSISWSPDGKHIASGSNDKTIKIWDVTTGNCIRTLGGHGFLVYSVAWSPNSKHIASGSKVWDASIGTHVYTLLRSLYHMEIITSVSWSPDGKYIASSSLLNMINICNIIDSKLDNYLKNTLSWQQALLLIYIIDAHNNKHTININHDIQKRQCYKSLPEDIKQLIKPLLPPKACTIL